MVGKTSTNNPFDCSAQFIYFLPCTLKCTLSNSDDDNYRSNRGAPPLRDHGPGPAVAAMMKLSSEEVHKNTICELGGLQIIGEILAVDFMANAECNDHHVVALRKYAGRHEEIL